MPCIAAILLMVAYNMSGWRTFLQVVCRSPKSDAAVLLLTFFLTVVFDLVVAIGVGLSLACLLFMTRMANVAVIKEWEYVEDQEDAQGRFRHVPEHVMVYEIDGPMFFGAADQIPSHRPQRDPPSDDPADAQRPCPGHHRAQQPGPAVEGVSAAIGCS